ncbi:MAG TPA: hypothetical protein VF432_29490 [Thermoanaerobaculia bacterium]
MRSTLAVILLFASVVVFAQSPPAGVVVLQLKEVPQNGTLDDKYQDCLTNKNCSADIKSSILITPDVSGVPGATKPLTPEQNRAIAVRQHLNRMLEHMNRSLELSKQIVLAEQTDSLAAVDLQALSRRFEAERSQMLQAGIDAVNADPQRFGLQPGGDARDVLPRTYGLPAETGQWVAQELERSAKVLVDTGAGTGYTLRLGAFRLRGGTDPSPIHLPNYDRFESRAPADLPRISLNISTAQQQQLQKDVAATAALAQAIRTNFAELLTAFQTTLRNVQNKLQTADTAFKELRERLTGGDLAQDIANLESALTAAIAASNDENVKRRLNAVKTELTAVKAAAMAITSDIQSFQQAIAGAKTQVADLTTGVDANRPDIVLLRILNVGSTLVQGFTAPLATLQTHVQNFTGAADRLQQAVAALQDSDAGKELAVKIANRFKAEASAVLAPLGDVEAVQKLLDALDAGGKTEQAIKTAAALLSYQEIFEIPVDSLVATTLDIPRADPEEGDQIELVAEVRKPDGGLAYEERRIVRPRFFGFHSGVTSGLVFVRAKNEEQADLEPEAAAIWRIVFDKRPADSWTKALIPAIGIHVTTLHFSEDQIEFGAGLSVHFWRDIVQFGTGINLGVKEDRGYVYAGLGVIPFLRERLSGLNGGSTGR